MEKYLKSINIFDFTKSGVSLKEISDSVLDLYNKNGNQNQDSYKEKNNTKFLYL